MQRHAHEHSLPEIAYRGDEDRPARQAAVSLDFRNVLVLEAEAIKLEGRRSFALMGRDHRLAASRVTADRVDGDSMVGRDEARIDERSDQRYGAGRVATGICDLAGLFDGLVLTLDHFRKAKDPSGRRAMGGRCVDDARCILSQGPDQGDAFPRGIIGHAKDGKIGLAQDFALRACVLAAFRVDREELDIAALRKPLANLQAGRPRFSIDEDFRGFRLLRGLSFDRCIEHRVGPCG